MLNIFTSFEPLTPYWYKGTKVIVLNAGWKDENGKFNPWVLFYWYSGDLTNKYIKRVSRLNFLLNSENYLI